MNTKLNKLKAERYYYKRLGYLLHYTRKKRKLNQSEVAEHLGLTRKSISLLERGETSIKLYELKLYCDLLKVSTSMIVDHIDDVIGYYEILEQKIKDENTNQQSG